MREEGSQRKYARRGLFQSIFPVEHDFEGMLIIQSEKTLESVHALVLWLKNTPLEEPGLLRQLEADVDAMRYDMEEKLLASFSTPFDRQDIYSLSRQMDYIVNYSHGVAREMHAFGVQPDEAIRAMADALYEGTKCIVDGVSVMSREREKVEELIRSARRSMHAIDDIYIRSMAELFRTEHAMEAMRRREVYHHLRDAGRALRATVDILHHAVVGLS